MLAILNDNLVIMPVNRLPNINFQGFIPNPAKHLCILVQAPLWHLICINFLQCYKQILGAIWDKLVLVPIYHHNLKHLCWNCTFY